MNSVSLLHTTDVLESRWSPYAHLDESTDGIMVKLCELHCSQGQGGLSRLSQWRSAIRSHPKLKMDPLASSARTARLHRALQAISSCRRHWLVEHQMGNTDTDPKATIFISCGCVSRISEGIIVWSHHRTNVEDIFLHDKFYQGHILLVVYQRQRPELITSIFMFLMMFDNAHLYHSVSAANCTSRRRLRWWGKSTIRSDDMIVVAALIRWFVFVTPGREHLFYLLLSHFAEDYTT